MTGKKQRNQIIIDGVDVSECTFFDKSSGYNICCCGDIRKNQRCTR